MLKISFLNKDNIMIFSNDLKKLTALTSTNEIIVKQDYPKKDKIDYIFSEFDEFKEILLIRYKGEFYNIINNIIK